MLPFVQSYNGFTNYYYSLFQPTILLLGIAAAIIFSVLSRYLKEKDFNRYYYPGTMMGIAIIGIVILYLALPQFINPLMTGLSIFQQKTGGASTVGEASPLFSDGGAFSLNNVIVWFPGILSFRSSDFIAIFFTTFAFALIALILLIIQNANSQKPKDVMIITWSLVILVMAIAQNRFTYYYGINVAILTGFLGIWVFQKLGLKVVKIFENVPGAVIKGSAPAGTEVIAAVPIMTNQNRAFIYQQSNTSDASDQFTLVLPYSTEGPAANGTKFDTKPMSGYQLSVENRTYELKVPEEYVLSGTVIADVGSRQT